MTTSTRQDPRYAVALDCRIRYGDTSHHGRSRDLSRSGTCCTLPTPIERSTLVEIELALAFDDDAYSEPLVLPAIVVWSTLFGAAHQIGFKFLDPTPDQLRFLDVFLQYLDS